MPIGGEVEMGRHGRGRVVAVRERKLRGGEGDLLHSHGCLYLHRAVYCGAHNYGIAKATPAPPPYAVRVNARTDQLNAYAHAP